MSDSKEYSPPESAGSGKKGLGVLALTGGILVFISLVFTHWDLDRNIAARFYSPEAGWFLREAEPWHWLYRYGNIPGIVLTLMALAGAVITYLRIPDKHWHRYCLLVVLTAIIGAGLLVNGLLKPYWGRPRPSQTREFGGQYRYRHVFNPGIPGKGSSFPSGHASMGFLFVVLAYFRRKSPAIAWIGAIGGIGYGGLMSATRVVQGAHFVTDCIWSLGVIWLVATVSYYFVLRIPAPGRESWRRLTRRQKQGVIGLGTLISVVLVLIFLTRRPFFETYYFRPGSVITKISELRVGLRGGTVRSGIRYSERGPLWVLIHARGFGLPSASEKPGIESVLRSGNVYQAIYRMEKQGYFFKLTHEIEVVIPRRLRNKLTVVFIDETGKPISQ